MPRKGGEREKCREQLGETAGEQRDEAGKVVWKHVLVQGVQRPSEAPKKESIYVECRGIYDTIPYLTKIYDTFSIHLLFCFFNLYSVHNFTILHILHF